jgi:hypothetical protein
MSKPVDDVRAMQTERSPEDVFTPPAWYFEQDLWVRDSASPGNLAHNILLALQFRGRLNAEILERSIEELLRRHGALRSAFRMVNGKLAQFIMAARRFTLPVLDVGRQFNGDGIEQNTRRIAREEARRPFDLTCGPMLRASLLRFGTEEHVLLLTTHHIVADHWSTTILVRELLTLYSAFSLGEPSPLPELPFQYGQYVRWLEPRLQGEELTERMNFWDEQLGSGQNYHHLALDHTAPAARSYRGARETAQLPEELTRSLKSLGQRERVTSFMVLLAGLQCLLRRYSGDNVIGVGSCVGNRPLVQVENLMGPFANVSVLCTDLAGNRTFREVLRRVRDASLSAFAYQDTPFGMLVDRFQPVRDTSRHPLFQVLFVLLNAPDEFPKPIGLEVNPVTIDTGFSCFELNLNLQVRRRVEIEVQYASDLFEVTTVKQLLSDYQTTLEAMVLNPESRISELQLPSFSRAGAA